MVSGLVLTLAACGGRHDAGADAAPPDARSDATGPDAGSEPDGAAPDARSASELDALLDALQGSAAQESIVQDALRQAAWGDGRPVTDGERWLFVTHWPDAPGSVALVGDFNGWDPAAHPAQQATWGGDYWVLLGAADLGDPAGQKYKWWATGDTWRAPPEATAYGYDGYGEFGYVRPPTGQAWLERFPDARLPGLSLPRTLRARLPPGFAPGTSEAARARVLVMHDGQNLFSPEAPWGGWQLESTLSAGWQDVVVLAVDNAADRMDVYAHVVEPDLPGVGGPAGGRADVYLDALLGWVLPFFESRYGLGADPARRLVAGSSLGGLVTLYQAMTRPGTLGCAAALSPTLGWGAFDPASDGSAALVRQWGAVAGHGPVAVYLDSGGGVTGNCLDLDGDGVYEDSDDQDNYCVTIQLRDTLESLGYAFGVDLAHYWEPGAPHNEAAWAARFWRALEACETAGWSR